MAILATGAPEHSLPREALDQDWLRDFYKECGRELTLAYTTLNQMKNWAILVLAPVLAAVIAMGNTTQAAGVASGNTRLSVAIVAAAVFSYVFTLRFFFRAIQCYINLLRWNTLQSAVVRFKLRPHPGPGADSTEHGLLDAIDNYYHHWRSPVARPEQVASNLKLGFGLVLALPLLLMCWGAYVHWDDLLVRGLVLFAIGGTVIEVTDFRVSRFFDTPDAAKKRKVYACVGCGVQKQIFPAPTGSVRYVLTWLANLMVATIVAFWPTVKAHLP